MNNGASLLTVIKTEFFKLRNCKVLWGMPLCAFLPDLLIFSMFAVNKKFPIVVWETFFKDAEMMFNMLMAIGIFALLAGFIFSREYQENTINSMFTYPIGRIQFFIGKLIVILILISITIVSSFILLVLLGLTIKHEPLTLNILLYYTKVYVFMILMHFALIPIIAFLSIYNKSIVPPTILAVSAITLNLLVINTPFNTLFPWTIPTILSPHLNGRTYTNYTLGIIVLCTTFIIGTILSIRSIKKDVQ
ncbi:ABC transporter permease [Clostridium estertheticum]|uniref:ABC transporter permease n=1 Tax=Clostridium estertheticum TaxID=238834 RepID=UPI001C0E4C10|nr:ABC transporter permease [Clostridium estertheticum]MBU3073882.1 ABC transporter permease [Clostridium estertheticum]MBU3163977.1 ABC transporter permease [Clostridium estertheticum]MCB2341103.1 ABC transporter permease [Clostridium estertheticum]